MDFEVEVLFDFNIFSDDGIVFLNFLVVSEDGKYMVYGFCLSGSDWVIIKVMKIEDKIVEFDILFWVSFF